MLQIKYKNSEKRPLWLVDAKYTMGRDNSCDLRVEDSRVAPQQAELQVSLEEVTLHNLGEPDLVSVNGEDVNEPRKLAHGDEVQVGGQAFELIDPKLLHSRGDSGPQASAVEQQTSGWSLRASNTALANRNFPIEREVVVGRSNECDITLGVAHLSRRHARLYFNGEQLEVEDLRSSNGTFVNGRKVERSLLRAGDELSLDTLSFLVIGPEDESDSTMLRPQPDVEKTNLRPAINVDEINKVSSAVSRPVKSSARLTPRPGSAGRRTQQQYVPEQIQQESGSSIGVVVGVAFAVIVAAAAAWFFLFQST